MYRTLLKNSESLLYCQSVSLFVLYRYKQWRFGIGLGLLYNMILIICIIFDVDDDENQRNTFYPVFLFFYQDNHIVAYCNFLFIVEIRWKLVSLILW